MRATATPRVYSSSPTGTPSFAIPRLLAFWSLLSDVFTFSRSKNQESTSEAVNAWYGLYLFGLATNNRRLADFGRVLLATEIRSARKYWQITKNTYVSLPYARSSTARKSIHTQVSN